MAHHVLDDGPPPEPLKMAWEIKQWGGDVGKIPERDYRAMNGAYNAYMALSGYVAAGGMNNTAGWARANPKAWALVSSIIADRIRGD